MKNSIVRRWGISVLGTTIFITIAIATFTCFFIKNNHYDIVRATLNSRANPLVMSYFESDYYVYDGLFNDMANDFVNEFADKDAKLKNNSILSLVLFGIGVIGFIALYLLRLFDAYWLIQDIVEVASWVFLWETVDVFVLNRGVLKWKQKRDLKIIFADIKITQLKK